MAEQPWYKEWFGSPFYHKLYFERNEEEAAAFIHRLISHLQLRPGSRMLDVACGRGRHSKLMARWGFDVTGIDLSPGNIALAQQFESDNLHFFVHDMRLPLWINYFDFAFNFFTSFGYFKTSREHDAAMRTIGGSLKPGGVFVIDYLNTCFTEEHLVPDEIKQIGPTQYEIHRRDDRAHFYKKITITDPSLSQPSTFTEKVAKFSLDDFTGMLASQSLQVQEVFGDYQLNPYDKRKTPRLIIIARKKTHPPEDKEKRLYSDGRTTDALT